MWTTWTPGRGCAAAALFLLGITALACAPGQPEVFPDARSAPRVLLLVGTTPVRVNVASTYAARQRGLAGATSLADDEGMLFVYRDVEPRQFWMKGCQIALDIAFLGPDGEVLLVETLPAPDPRKPSLPRTSRSPPSAYVLELPAGFFGQHGLSAGTRVQIPPSVRRSKAE